MSFKTRVVIFDIDGTLVDAYKAIAQSLNRALVQLNYPPADDDEIRRKVGFGQKHLLECFLKPQDVDKALSIYRHYHRRTRLSHRLFHRCTFDGIAGELHRIFAAKIGADFAYFIDDHHTVMATDWLVCEVNTFRC